MAALIYSLCALTSLAAAGLLWRAWAGSRAPLLFWSALCFLMLAANNVLLVLDKVVWPVEVDLRTARLGTALAAVVVLLVGLVWEDD
ncbi:MULTISPECIES: DUF5985 family protein [Ramlibacter]|uniref:Uncharacterized protein n=1 Tax=Ramlibacter pinisoli TaxID=2682844 RepID=A0A6N8IVF5_9BURK|nr:MULTISPECIES: DUF5985 family protein [Ramlibacter]MBA2960978.1 hypothetical protein [Ramlibacter sp. CGMCC 1.13660]MVQ30924.1 hypothetical protein [Ramlibacter pinisoli]